MLSKTQYNVNVCILYLFSNTSFTFSKLESFLSIT